MDCNVQRLANHIRKGECVACALVNIASGSTLIFGAMVIIYQDNLNLC